MARTLRQCMEASCMQLVGKASLWRHEATFVPGSVGSDASEQLHLRMMWLWRHIFWHAMPRYCRLRPVPLSVSNGFRSWQRPYGSPIRTFLRGRTPNDAEKPGGTSKPSANGKGSVSGGWTTTRTPSLADTALWDSCRPGSTRTSVDTRVRQAWWIIVNTCRKCVKGAGFPLDA